MSIDSSDFDGDCPGREICGQQLRRGASTRRPFPNTASAESQISNGGGLQPIWSRDGRELFYLTPSGTLMSLPVEEGATWRAGPAVEVLKGVELGGGGFRSYDVSGDGRRFLILKEHVESGTRDDPARGIVVVQDWFTELNRRVPTR